MANWKKVIVSGSDISQLNNDSSYLISGDSGVILSGSFSGSFQGDGSNLTGVVASAPNTLDQGNGIETFSYDGSTAGIKVGVDSGSLAGNGITTSGGAFVVQAADSTISVGAGGISVDEANLSGIPNSALTNDDVTLGNTSVALGGTASTVDGLILTGAEASGSFSGSFQGNFTGTTDLPDLTDGNGIADFTYDGSGTAAVAVEADSTTGGNTKPVTVGANGVGFDISTIDGAGLGTSGGELVVNVDDSSIEINSDSLRVKLSGIANAMLANDSVTLGSTEIDLGTTASTIAGLILTGVEASGSFTGSFTGDGSGLTGLASTLNIIGDTGTDGVDLLNDTLDFEGTANEIVTAVTDNKVTFSLPDDVTIGGNLIVSNDLTVLGTASFQETTNLTVADRFVLFASGSNSPTDGGIVVQQSSDGTGELFGFDAGESRWAVDSAFDATTSTFTPEAFMAAISTGAASSNAAINALVDDRYEAKGNIFVGDDEGIWIYS